MSIFARLIVIASFVVTLSATSANSDGPKDAVAEKAIQQAFQDALKAAAEIPDLFERGMAIAEIAQVQARTGAKDAAEKTFRNAVKTARKLPADNANEAKDRVTLLLIIVQRHMAGYDWAGARALVDDIVANEPLRKFGGVPQHELDSLADLLVAWQVRAGQFDEAWKSAQIGDKASNRDYVRQGRALALAQAKNWQAALATTAQMADVAERATVSVEIAVLLHKAGLKDQARQIMQKARDDAAGMEASSANSVRAKLARAYAQTENRAAALEMGALVINRSATYPYPIREMTLASMHLDLGDTDQALKQARLARAIGATSADASFREVVSAQSRLRQFKQAHQTAIEIKLGYVRMLALLDIGKEQYRAGLKDEAAETFRLAMRTDDETPVPPLAKHSFARDDAKVFGEIAAAQAEVGEAKSARIWLSRQIVAKNQAYGFVGLAEGLHKRMQAAQAK